MSEPHAATDTEIRESLASVLASPQFADAPKLSAFLRYIVERTLDGEADNLKEYSVATSVFDRPADFDPRLDTIVRVQASKLRSRLSEYYSTTRSGTVRIQIPRGSYVPVFERASEIKGRVAEAAIPEQPSLQSPRRASFWMWGAMLAIAGVAFGAGLMWVLTMPRVTSSFKPIRFVVSPPPGATFKQTPQISPDGRLTASIIEGQDGGRSIYMYSLESGSGYEVPGTAGATMPWWSSDGKTFFFVAGTALNSLDRSSGVVSWVANFPGTGFGADRNSGNILLFGNESGGIQQMSASGGAVHAVTTLDLSHHEIAHSFPQFLPGGKCFLYFARSQPISASAIAVASLDGKINMRLLSADSRAVFVPDVSGSLSSSGYLFRVNGSVLLAQPFDTKKLRFTGEPRQVASGMQSLPYGAANFSASPSGVLVYRTDDGGPEGQFTWYDRAGHAIGTLGPPGLKGDPVLSPDGESLAFDLQEGPNRDIWIASVASGKFSRLTFDPDVDHCPVWSSDGHSVLFESHRYRQGVYIKNINGASREMLVAADADRPSGSVDGFVLFDSMHPLIDVRGIWLSRLDGRSRPREWLRTAANEDQATVSPDGKWIAYTSTEHGQTNVNVQSFDISSAAARGQRQISVNGGSQPVWRADGKELYFLSSENRLMAAAVRTGSGFDNDVPVTLFDPHIRLLRGPCTDYTTHDGKRFLVRVPVQPAHATALRVVTDWPYLLKP